MAVFHFAGLSIDSAEVSGAEAILVAVCLLWVCHARVSWVG